MTCKVDEGPLTPEEENSKALKKMETLHATFEECTPHQTLINSPESNVLQNKFSGKETTNDTFQALSDNGSAHIQEHPSIPSGLEEPSRMICKLENGPVLSEPFEEKEREKPNTHEDCTSVEISTSRTDLVEDEFNMKKTTTSKFQAVPRVENGLSKKDVSMSTEVMQVGEDDLNCSESLDKHHDFPHRIFDGPKEKPGRGKDVHHSFDVVYDLARFKPYVRSIQFRESLGSPWKGVMTLATPGLLGLLLLTSLLGDAAASPLSATPRVQGNGRAEQGQAYSLTCVVEGFPGADTTSSYVWYKNGDIIREEAQQVLTFTRLTQEDAGNFQCGPKRPPRLGILLSHPFQIRVFGMHKVIPKPMLGAWTIPVLHQRFELTCTVFGLPQNHNIHLTYTWFKDLSEIPGQTSRSLLFSRLTREDEGMYVCRARSGHMLTTSPDSNEKHLRILLPPRVHMEPATPDNVIGRAAGEELTLTCKVTEAFPWVSADGYSWSYLPSHQGPLQTVGGRESTLRLGPLTREHSGQYFCQARNDLHSFHGLLSPGTTSVTVDVLYIEQIALTPDLEVNEGERLTLTCRVPSNPAAHLTWIVDGREVRHVTFNVDNYVLERATCSDSKTYTCRASNPDLPGLKRHASTSVRVNCNENEIRVPPGRNRKMRRQDGKVPSQNELYDASVATSPRCCPLGLGKAILSDGFTGEKMDGDCFSKTKLFFSKQHCYIQKLFWRNRYALTKLLLYTLRFHLA